MNGIERSESSHLYLAGNLLHLKISIPIVGITKTFAFQANKTILNAADHIRDYLNNEIEQGALSAHEGKLTAEVLSHYMFYYPQGNVWLQGGRQFVFYKISNASLIEFKDPFRMQRILLSDNSVRAFKIKEDDLVASIVSSICDKLGILINNEYALAIAHSSQGEAEAEVEAPPGETKGSKIVAKEKSKEKPKEKKEKKSAVARKSSTTGIIETDILWLDSEKTLLEQNCTPNTLLELRKRFFFFDSTISSGSELEVNLLYEQLKESILSGQLPVQVDSAIELASYILQIQKGDMTSLQSSGFSSSSESLRSVFPIADLLHKGYHKQKGIERSIIQKWSGLNRVSAKDCRFRFVKLCRSLPTFGVTFFIVKEKASSTYSASKESKDKKWNDVLLGVSKSHVLRVDCNTKNLLKQWPLETIRRWATADDSFTLDFGDYLDEYYTVLTTEGQKINKVIAGYIDLIMKKRKHAEYSRQFEDGEELDIAEFQNSGSFGTTRADAKTGKVVRGNIGRVNVIRGTNTGVAMKTSNTGGFRQLAKVQVNPSGPRDVNALLALTETGEELGPTQKKTKRTDFMPSEELREELNGVNQAYIAGLNMTLADINAPAVNEIPKLRTAQAQTWKQNKLANSKMLIKSQTPEILALTTKLLRLKNGLDSPLDQLNPTSENPLDTNPYDENLKQQLLLTNKLVPLVMEAAKSLKDVSDYIVPDDTSTDNYDDLVEEKEVILDAAHELVFNTLNLIQADTSFPGDTSNTPENAEAKQEKYEAKMISYTGLGNALGTINKSMMANAILESDPHRKKIGVLATIASPLEDGEELEKKETGRAADMDLINKALEKLASQIIDASSKVNDSVVVVSKGAVRHIQRQVNPDHQKRLLIVQENINNESEILLATATSMHLAVATSPVCKERIFENCKRIVALSSMLLPDEKTDKEHLAEDVLAQHEELKENVNQLIKVIESVSEELDTLITSDPAAYQQLMITKLNLDREKLKGSDMVTLDLILDEAITDVLTAIQDMPQQVQMTKGSPLNVQALQAMTTRLQPLLLHSELVPQTLLVTTTQLVNAAQHPDVEPDLVNAHLRELRAELDFQQRFREFERDLSKTLKSLDDLSNTARNSAQHNRNAASQKQVKAALEDLDPTKARLISLLQKLRSDMRETPDQASTLQLHLLKQCETLYAPAGRLIAASRVAVPTLSNESAARLLTHESRETATHLANLKSLHMQCQDNSGPTHLDAAAHLSAAIIATNNTITSTNINKEELTHVLESQSITNKERLGQGMVAESNDLSSSVALATKQILILQAALDGLDSTVQQVITNSEKNKKGSEAEQQQQFATTGQLSEELAVAAQNLMFHLHYGVKPHAHESSSAIELGTAESTKKLDVILPHVQTYLKSLNPTLFMPNRGKYDQVKEDVVVPLRQALRELMETLPGVASVQGFNHEIAEKAKRNADVKKSKGTTTEFTSVAPQYREKIQLLTNQILTSSLPLFMESHHTEKGSSKGFTPIDVETYTKKTEKFIQDARELLEVLPEDSAFTPAVIEALQKLTSASVMCAANPTDYAYLDQLNKCSTELQEVLVEILTSAASSAENSDPSLSSPVILDLDQAIKKLKTTINRFTLPVTTFYPDSHYQVAVSFLEGSLYALKQMPQSLVGELPNISAMVTSSSSSSSKSSDLASSSSSHGAATLRKLVLELAATVEDLSSNVQGAAYLASICLAEMDQDDEDVIAQTSVLAVPSVFDNEALSAQISELKSGLERLGLYNVSDEASAKKALSSKSLSNSPSEISKLVQKILYSCKRAVSNIGHIEKTYHSQINALKSSSEHDLEVKEMEKSLDKLKPARSLIHTHNAGINDSHVALNKALVAYQESLSNNRADVLVAGLIAPTSDLLTAVDALASLSTDPDFSGKPAKLGPDAIGLQKKFHADMLSILQQTLSIFFSLKKSALGELKPAEKKDCEELQQYTSEIYAGVLDDLHATLLTSYPGQRELESAKRTMETVIEDLINLSQSIYSRKIKPRTDSTIEGFQEVLISNLKSTLRCLDLVSSFSNVSSESNDSSKSGKPAPAFAPGKEDSASAISFITLATTLNKVSTHFIAINNAALGFVSKMTKIPTQETVLNGVRASIQYFLSALNHVSPQQYHDTSVFTQFIQHTKGFIEELLQMSHSNLTGGNPHVVLISTLIRDIEEALVKLSTSSGSSTNAAAQKTSSELQQDEVFIIKIETTEKNIFDMQANLQRLLRRGAASSETTVDGASSPLHTALKGMTTDFIKMIDGLVYLVVNISEAQGVKGSAASLGQSLIQLLNGLKADDTGSASSGMSSGGSSAVSSTLKYDVSMTIQSNSQAIQKSINQLLILLQKSINGAKACERFSKGCFELSQEFGTLFLFASAGSLTSSSLSDSSSLSMQGEELEAQSDLVSASLANPLDAEEIKKQLLAHLISLARISSMLISLNFVSQQNALFEQATDLYENVTKLADKTKRLVVFIGSEDKSGQELLLTIARDIFVSFSKFYTLKNIESNHAALNDYFRSYRELLKNLDDPVERCLRTSELAVVGLSAQLARIRKGPAHLPSSSSSSGVSEPATSGIADSNQYGNTNSLDLVEQNDVKILDKAQRLQKSLVPIMSSLIPAINKKYYSGITPSVAEFSKLGQDLSEILYFHAQLGPRSATHLEDMLCGSLEIFRYVLTICKRDSGSASSSNTVDLLECSRKVNIALNKIASLLKEVATGTTAENEETKVEKELEEASEVIFAAVEKLKVVQENTTVDISEGISVSEDLLSVVKKVASSSSSMILAAIAAQKELAAQGQLNNKSDKKRYHEDAKWSEGLVSAAKTVAVATKLLLECAASTVDGLDSEDRLLAISNAVSSATQQLVMAGRTKAAADSAGLEAILKSAADVKKNIAQMMAAARAAGEKNTRETQVLETKMKGNMIAQEISLQETLLKRERELSEARKKLTTYRKNQYK